MTENDYPNLDDEQEFSNLVGDIGACNKGNPIWFATSLCAKNSSIIDHIGYLSGLVDVRRLGIIGFFKLFLMRIYRNHLLAPRRLRKRLKRQITQIAPRNLFFSLISKNSFNDGKYQKNYHWADLIQKNASREPVAILGYIISDEHFVSEMLCQNNFQDNILLCPLECFMDMSVCLRAMYMTLLGAVRMPTCIWRGNDISAKLKHLVDIERSNGEIFDNLCRYYAYKKMLKSFTAKRIYYPWENHSWEKLLLLAVESRRPDLQVYGYQHGALPLMYINHFPSPNEYRVQRYPDKIFTAGTISRNILKHYGTFPDKCLTVGVGLRQDYLHSMPLKTAPLSKGKLTIGVATPTEVVDTVRTFENIISLNKKHRLLLRLYPLMPQSIIKDYFEQDFEHIEFSNGDIDKFLQDIDILIYTNTSVGIEAVNLGTPAIYFDVGRHHKGDTMFNNTTLKWTASNIAELNECINIISSLPIEELNRQRAQAREYVNEYFRPVTSERLDAMLES